MSFLEESREFMTEIVSGSPEERVETLLGKKFSAEYHNAAKQLLELLYPMGVIDRDGKMLRELGIDDLADHVFSLNNEPVCAFGKLCTAAERFEEIYAYIVPFVDRKLQDGTALSGNDWPLLLKELKIQYKNEYDDEIDIVFVYHLVAEKGVEPVAARKMAGLENSGWVRSV